jgi:hypothetical protein
MTPPFFGLGAGTAGYATLMFNDGSEVHTFDFRCQKEGLADNPEMLAQGRFRENAERKRLANEKPFYASPDAAILAFIASRPDLSPALEQCVQKNWYRAAA